MCWLECPSTRRSPIDLLFLPATTSPLLPAAVMTAKKTLSLPHHHQLIPPDAERHWWSGLLVLFAQRVRLLWHLPGLDLLILAPSRFLLCTRQKIWLIVVNSALELLPTSGYVIRCHRWLTWLRLVFTLKTMYGISPLTCRTVRETACDPLAKFSICVDR